MCWSDLQKEDVKIPELRCLRLVFPRHVVYPCTDFSPENPKMAKNGPRMGFMVGGALGASGPEIPENRVFFGGFTPIRVIRKGKRSIMSRIWGPKHPKMGSWGGSCTPPTLGFTPPGGPQDPPQGGSRGGSQGGSGGPQGGSQGGPRGGPRGVPGGELCTAPIY